MNKKVIGISVLMLMILTMYPVVGFPILTENVNHSNFAQSFHQAPSPGDIPRSPPLMILDKPIIRKHPEKIAVNIDDIVISMLKQVDETIYLRYLENLTAFGPRVTGLGADDDTSGTIAVLMAAYIMSQSQYKFNHTIKFVAFSGEEQHKLGSQIYAVEAAEKGWNIAGVLNADMISYAEATYSGNNLIVFQNDASEWLYNYTCDINTEYADYIHLTLHNGGFSSGSDHYYFWMEGYSALFYFEYTMTPYYHTADDTIANINAPYAVKNIRLLLATLAELSESSQNNAPYTPIITGETNGDIQTSYDYTIQTTDPDQNDVLYHIDWGDNTTTITDLNESRVVVIVSHIWDTEGTYNVRVKFQRFPNTFPILRQLIEY